MKMKDLDSMDIEQLIKLPFFFRLEKELPNGKAIHGTTPYWKITFRCNKALGHQWGLLDQVFNEEFVTKFKLI